MTEPTVDDLVSMASQSRSGFKKCRLCDLDEKNGKAGEFSQRMREVNAQDPTAIVWKRVLEIYQGLGGNLRSIAPVRRHLDMECSEGPA